MSELSPEKFHLVQVQATVFTPDHNFSSSRFVSQVLKDFAARFDGDVQSLPLPDKVPPEVPRVVLTSKDKSLRLEGALSRINITWLLVNNVQARLANQAVELADVLLRYLRSTQERVSRMGFVVNRVGHTPQPAADLIAHFCNDAIRERGLQQSRNFEVHNHDVVVLNVQGTTVPMNRWIRFRTARVAANGMPVIGVEQDFNTIQEGSDKLRFTPELIQTFFNSVPQDADATLATFLGA